MSGFSHSLTLQSVPQLISWSHSKFLPNLGCSETRMYSLNNSVLSSDLRHPKGAGLPPEFLRNHIVLSWGSCTRQIQLVTFLYGNAFGVPNKTDHLSASDPTGLSLVVPRHQWWPRPALLPLTPPTMTSKGNQKRVRVGTRGVLSVHPSCPHLSTSREGEKQELEAHSATECRTGEGRRILGGLSWPVPPAQPGTACALSFHFHCWLLRAIHNAKVNSYAAQFGIHKNTHQSAKEKKKTLKSFEVYF